MVARMLVVVLLASSGCSLFLRGVPDDWEPPADPECQPFIIVPIVDGALGLGVTAWALGDPCRDSAVNCAIGLAGGAALVAAGVYGYLKVKKCNAAKTAAREAVSSPDDAPEVRGPEVRGPPAFGPAAGSP